MGRGMAPEPTLTRQRGGRKLPNNRASPRCPDGKRVASSRLEGAAQADFIQRKQHRSERPCAGLARHGGASCARMATRYSIVGMKNGMR
jgi:hypothetical protein